MNVVQGAFVHDIHIAVQLIDAVCNWPLAFVIVALALFKLIDNN